MGAYEQSPVLPINRMRTNKMPEGQCPGDVTCPVLNKERLQGPKNIGKERYFYVKICSKTGRFPALGASNLRFWVLNQVFSARTLRCLRPLRGEVLVFLRVP